MTDFRIGHGYDVHAFQAGDHIMLGGVAIPHDKSFAAHSDGDVLLHAVCDAMLGAMALGDIGQHFPDTDSAYKNIDSRELLKSVSRMVQTAGYEINNLDATIIAQAPKLLPYIAEMRSNICQDLNLFAKQCNIKATTTEKLGFSGREEGIAVHCVVLLHTFPEEIE